MKQSIEFECEPFCKGCMNVDIVTLGNTVYYANGIPYRMELGKVTCAHMSVCKALANRINAQQIDGDGKC